MRSRSMLFALVFLAGAVPAAEAAPRVPASDAEVLERLPSVRSDPALRDLRAWRAALAQRPDDLTLAVQVARRYVELGRTSGDPRYAGYAQAALGPWWSSERPPTDVLLLRATLHQRVHDFDAALADLNAVLAINPRNAQAHLTRATVLAVQGRFADARVACGALERLAAELIWRACADGIGGLTGDLEASRARLQAALMRDGTADPGMRAWILTGLAEMALRAGRLREAESHFRAALAADPDDVYLLAAWSDHLLDRGRPAEVMRLLEGRTRVDALLLRYALAADAIGSEARRTAVDQLRARFDASRRRGDRVHLREEARYALHLTKEPGAALALARANWAVQKEPGDARVLLEAAMAAGDASGCRMVETWVTQHRLEDAKITNLLRKWNPNHG